MPDGGLPDGVLPDGSVPARFLRDDAADTVRGIVLVACCYVLMVAGDIAGKWALPAAGVAWLMVGRGIVGVAATVAVIMTQPAPSPGSSLWRRLMPVRWGLVLTRAALHSGVSISWYVAWLMIPLADAYAIGFTAPLLMTLLAIPLLGEVIRWRRALSTMVGFCGVLIMVRPGTALWSPVLLVLMPGIFGMAVSRIMARQLSTTETPECLTVWLMLAHIPAGLLILPWFPGVGPLGWDLAVAFLALGVLNAVAHCMMARGYGLAPVSAVAPYEYSTLLWGALFAWLVFREAPAWSSLAGAAVVAAAGLYNLHRERVRRAEEARCPT